MRSALLPIALLVGVGGCSGEDGLPSRTDAEEAGSTPGLPGTATGFEGSDALVERFGSRTTRDDDPDVDEATLGALVAAVNELSLSLHRAVAEASTEDAVVTSGFSAATVLSLAEAGTADATRDALRNLLGVDALDEPAVHAAMNALALALDATANEDLVLRSVNRMFVREGLPLAEPYLDRSVVDYGAPLTEADFAGAADEITRQVNDWVSEQTDGFIPSIIERFDPGTTIALLNALFLDATWRDAYTDVGTIDFTGRDGRTRAVSAFGGRAELERVAGEGVRGVELPYAGGDVTMLILVPEDLASFESALDGARLDTLLDGSALREVELVVPKWEADNELDLSALLGPLGLPSSPWNFGRMIEEPAPSRLDVLVRQRARIEVDEDGTRAAAATGIIGVTSVPDEAPEIFAVDRPFVYLLRHRPTGLLLFTGRVAMVDGDD